MLIEKRKDISKMTRYCSEHIILEENYNGDTMIVEPGKPLNSKGWIDEDSVNKLRSVKNGWEIEFKGALCPVTRKVLLLAQSGAQCPLCLARPASLCLEI